MSDEHKLVKIPRKSRLSNETAMRLDDMATRFISKENINQEISKLNMFEALALCDRIRELTPETNHVATGFLDELCRANHE